MTFMTYSKFSTAVDAVRDALKEAIDTPNFDRNTLSEVWRHYQGLTTILESLEQPNETTAEENYSFNFGAAESINYYGSSGQDIITFSN